MFPRLSSSSSPGELSSRELNQVRNLRALNIVSCTQPLELPERFNGIQDFKSYCSILLECNGLTVALAADAINFGNRDAAMCASACQCTSRQLWKGVLRNPMGQEISSAGSNLPRKVGPSHNGQYVSTELSTQYKPRNIDSEGSQKIVGRSFTERSSTTDQSQRRERQDVDPNVPQIRPRSVHQPENRPLRIVPLKTFTGDGYLHCNPATTKVIHQKGHEQTVTCRAFVRCLKGAIEKRTPHTPDSYLQNCRAQCHCNDDANGVSARSVNFNGLERTSDSSRLGLNRKIVREDDGKLEVVAIVGA